MTDPEKQQSTPPKALPVTPPQAVPVFNCVVYVSRDSEGNVQARSAHLPTLQVAASSERDALRKIATEFKQLAADAHERGEELALEQPLPIRDQESQRMIPVHL